MGRIGKKCLCSLSPSAVSLSHTNTYRGTGMVTHSQADGGLVLIWHVANSNTAAYTHTHTHTLIHTHTLYSYSFCSIRNWPGTDSYVFTYNMLLCLLCSPRLRLFDQNTVRQLCWEILLQVKITIFYFDIYFKCNLFLWCQNWVSSIITPVFSGTWSSEIIIICWFAAQNKVMLPDICKVWKL